MTVAALFPTFSKIGYGVYSAFQRMSPISHIGQRIFGRYAQPFPAVRACHTFVWGNLSDDERSPYTMRKNVSVFDTTARDGLQGKPFVNTSVKIHFIDLLTAAGLQDIEVTSFVNPKVIPQSQDAEEVCRGIVRKSSVRYWALVPNIAGFSKAYAGGIRHMGVFTTVSETFSQANTNCSIDESFERFRPIVESAKHLDVVVRAYLSCCFRCPFEGKQSPQRVAELARRLFWGLGVEQVVISDTMGTASAAEVTEVLGEASLKVPPKHLAVHFHGEGSQVLSNIVTALSFGIPMVDASVGNVGGCPAAKGAKGNAPTENVVSTLHTMGIKTGVNLQKLTKARNYLHGHLEKAK